MLPKGVEINCRCHKIRQGIAVQLVLADWLTCITLTFTFIDV